MRWDYGRVYKEIRKSKGITQKEVCGDFLSRSTLINIEQGKVVPSFDNMIYLLNQIDMSLEEFTYICNIYHPSQRQSIIIETNNLLTTPEVSKIEELLKSCDDCLSREKDIPIENLKNILEMFLWIRTKGIQKDDPEYQRLANVIWEPLSQRDTWYVSDFRLLNAVIHYFDVDQLQQISPYIFKHLEKYKDYRNIQNDQRALLINLSLIYLNFGYLSECEEILLHLLSICKQTKRYDSLGLAQVRLGICRRDTALIEKGKELLSLCEEELLQLAELEIDRYLTTFDTRD